MQDTHLKRPSDLPRPELLAMLAEEAMELAHAALKYRRAMDGTNPTPKEKRQCMMDLIEEIGDVELCVEVLQQDDFPLRRNELEIAKQAKYDRWVARLNDEADS